jgi:hypothetical protein
MNIRIITFIVSIIIIIPISSFAQIEFKEDNEELINIGQAGTVNAFVREINNDSIYVVWKILDLKATGSDNIFMAYEREPHDVQFGITYKDLDRLSSWINERQKSKTGGTVTIGEWKFSYVQSVLGIPIFMLTGPTGNFEVGFSKYMRTRLLNEESIKRDIEKYNYRKAREEKRDARRKKNN